MRFLPLRSEQTSCGATSRLPVLHPMARCPQCDTLLSNSCTHWLMRPAETPKMLSSSALVTPAAPSKTPNTESSSFTAHETLNFTSASLHRPFGNFDHIRGPNAAPGVCSAASVHHLLAIDFFEDQPGHHVVHVQQIGPAPPGPTRLFSADPGPFRGITHGFLHLVVR